MTWCFYSGLGIALLVLMFLVWLKVINRVGCRTTVADAGRFLQWPMSRGLDGSKVRLRRPGTKYRLDFEKHIPADGKTRFQMVLDSRRCSASEFQAAQEALRQREIEFSIEPDPIAWVDRLIVQFGPDVERAALSACAVFTEGFGLDLDDAIRASHWGYFDVDMSKEPMAGWFRKRSGDDSEKTSDGDRR